MSWSSNHLHLIALLEVLSQIQVTRQYFIHSIYILWVLASLHACNHSLRQVDCELSFGTCHHLHIRDENARWRMTKQPCFVCCVFNVLYLIKRLPFCVFSCPNSKYSVCIYPRHCINIITVAVCLYQPYRISRFLILMCPSLTHRLLMFGLISWRVPCFIVLDLSPFHIGRLWV